MTHFDQLWLFFVIVFGVVLLPGLDMAYVLGSALTGGRGTGLAAVAGIVTGGMCLVSLTTLGIGLLLKTVPAVFNLLLLAGALYIAWIGYTILRSRSAFAAEPSAEKQARWITFRRGVLTIMLNPKAYLFMLAIFPQFLRPKDGALWLQAMVLWVIIAATQFSVYGSVALAADQVRGRLLAKPAAGILVSRAVGVALIGAAALTAYDSWVHL